MSRCLPRGVTPSDGPRRVQRVLGGKIYGMVCDIRSI